MSRIVKLARQDGRTVIASIHQPSSEVFELFSDLCLLSTGITVYFGPVSMAEEVQEYLFLQYIHVKSTLSLTFLNLIEFIFFLLKTK